ncbi:MAG: AMP-binding protein [Burkholderiales bacterium]|nr:AMP-binding protein [Burkholderiales bacterium]
MAATLAAFLDARAAAHPDAPALFDRDRPVGYARLADEARRLAAGLAALGVGRGDRVAVWLPNLPAWLACLFACARLGAIAVSVNTRFRSGEVADIVGRSGCTALVFWPGFRKIDFAGVLDACDPAALAGLAHVIAYTEGDSAPGRVIGRAVTRYDALAAHAPLAEDRGAPEAGCVIFTTSGTTRAPKFVLHDQRTAIRHGLDVARDFGWDDPATRVLVTAPLCGVFGLANAMGALAAARPLVMYPTFDAREAALAVRRHAVTHANATDEMIAGMLAAVPEARPFPSARWFGFAAFSPAHADLPRRAAARGLDVIGLYGSSELWALFARQRADAPEDERWLAGGRPVAPEAQVRARDPESGALQPHGSAGELEFAAPSRMAGYFGDEAATRAALTDDGFFRSGDLGCTTGDGRFVFLARIGDALRLSGFLVSPAEIEDVLAGHPSVAAAQVVGARASAGLQPVAFVLLAPGAALDEPALVAHCAARIARFKVPARVLAIDAFPVTPGANATKIQKHRLRELAEAALRENR